MAISQYRIELIEELEYIASKNCHNRFTQNSDGTDGRTYRYPVHMDNPNDHYAEYIYRGILNGSNQRSLGTLHYEFGANDFYIGDALNQILDYLESRYDIDFDNMEMQYQYSNDDED